MYQIPSDFADFISPGCDRKAFIQKYLNKAGIDCPVIQLEGKNHLYVKFPLSQYNPMFKIKTVIAHYDRVEGSPGANDNSAAVFCLLQFAQKLVKNEGCHNIRIIFTDGEELGQNGVKDQGAFALAQEFKRLGLVNDDIFVFDCMGRGNIPIICENNLPSGVSPKLLGRVIELEGIAETIIKKASGGKWFKLPTNYSDNASFIVNGIPAVAVTLLPSQEVTEALAGKTPKTWSLFHTPKDNQESLDPTSFELFQKILDTLATTKTLQSI